MNAIAQAARELLGKAAPMPRVREVVESGVPFDADLWAAMVDQGWTGLLVPEASGGLGLGPTEVAGLSHELGRALAPVPFVGTAVLAAPILGAAGERACVAFADEQVVLDALPDSLIVGVANDTAEQVDGTITAQPGLDLTRSLGTVARRGGAPMGPCAAEPVADLGRLALSAEAVGAAERALEMSVQYAKDREQFGKPIGSFQAVQHLLADMLRHVEMARAATLRAADAMARGDDRAHEWCLIAKAKSGESCVAAVEIGIQVHGGIGYTWEHDIHLYYRRVRSNAALLGDPAWCRRALAGLVLDAS